MSLLSLSAPDSGSYEAYYGFAQPPFALTPDPHFLYRSESHADAIARLLHALRRRSGVIVLTGDIGTGKTTICRALIQQLDANTFTSLVLNPFLSFDELLRETLLDFGVLSRETVRSGRAAAASTHELLGTLRDFLLSLVTIKGTAVLIIDEAQQLPPRVLEQIHVLSNLETSEAKLLQIVLVGQLNLLDVLAQADMRQINQRVSLRAMLAPLNREEVEAYIGHRLGVAQGSTDTSFQPDALDLVHRYSGGVPRIINLICDRALMGGAAVREPAISASHVRHAAQDLGLPPLPSAPPRRFLATPRWAAVLLIGVLALAGAIGAVLVTHPLDTWVQTVPPAPPVAPLPITAPPALAIPSETADAPLALPALDEPPAAAPVAAPVPGIER